MFFIFKSPNFQIFKFLRATWYPQIYKKYFPGVVDEPEMEAVGAGGLYYGGLHNGQGGFNVF